MNSRCARATVAALLGLLSGTMIAEAVFAQSSSRSAATAREPAAPWDQGVNTAAVQADAWFDNYRFRDGKTLARLKIHYATLGTPRRDSKGESDTEVLEWRWPAAARA